MSLHSGLPSLCRWSLFLSIAWFAAVVHAQGFRLTDTRRQGNTVTVGYQARGGYYYILLHGSSLPRIDSPIAAEIPTQPLGSLQDGNAAQATGFYRVIELAVDRPRDTDGDAIDDVYELQTAGLDWLDPTDANTPVPGEGGRTYLDIYREYQTPLTTLAETSPFNGEDGVAVTREMVLRLTRPLATNTVLTISNLHAHFGGRRILSRVEIASDRRSVTLFHLEDLPASARVRVTFDPADARDDLGRRLDPAGSGQPGSIARIDFDTLSITPVGETAVLGWVYASAPVPDGRGGFTNHPLVNVTVTVDGAEETLRTTTGPDGSFRLQPAPAGRFFVRVDGRTATESDWPLGAYYPVVGKSWEALPGVTTNLANGTGVIYLPLVPADALRPVSTTSDTVIGFPPSVVAANPAFAGVEVRVPPNALFDNSGQRGGRVGLAPVAPDRLPEPLPAGLEHLLNITVQSDGPQNFDRPVPVRFPNLPSPSTGQSLPPGAKTALVSFNHDLGRWEVTGSMTVSADGRFLDSDEGFGVRQPGWHGWQRLTWPEMIPPITFPPINPWIIAELPPTGPLPPPFPQPPGPVPPDPNPDPEWPPIPQWPDDHPDPWPPFPPWPDNPPTPDAPPIDGPPDDPQGPGPNGGGGGGGGSPGQAPGVSAGPFCLTPDIEAGCTNSGVLIPGVRTVPVNPNGGSIFNLRYSELNGTITAEVITRASGRLAFATQVNPIRPPDSVGFGPAEQAFVHVFRQATPTGLSGDEVVQLVTLRENAQSYAPSKTITLGASYLNASAVRFSPHGRYLIYTALKTDGKIALIVIDVVTRQTVFSGNFPYSTAPVLVQPGDMVQFGPDCADRTMVFQFGDTPTSLAWHLVNLETRRVVASRQIAPGNLSSWEFTSCGDAVKLNPAPAAAPVLLATLDGRVLTDLNDASPSSRASLQTLQSRLFSQPVASATNTLASRPLYSRGLHYWLLVDLFSGAVVQRGRSGGSGVLMEGVMLAPNRPFRLFALRAADFQVGRADFLSGNVGLGFRPPYVVLAPDLSGDADGDGLSDNAEFIAGTRADRADSNGDGINDAASVRAGLDPVAGGALATGIVAAVPLPGAAVDVCAVGDRVFVALGSAGIAVLQHAPGRTPTVIARVDTPGDARRVACSGNFLAVADGPAGLQVVDISDPPAARISRYLPSLGEVHCVTAADGVGYVGTQSGRVVWVDLATGTELGRLTVGTPVQDLQLSGDRLYVLSNRRLLVFQIGVDELVASGPGVTSGSNNPANRLFVGGGWAYITHIDGYRVFSLADPDAPVESTTASDTQVGWSQLVANGSGLGLAAAGPQLNANNQVQVYNLSDPARNTQFITRYTTPGAAASVASHLGIGYVATTTAGLQVLNYLAADSGTNPPSIQLSATFPLTPAEVEAGRFIALQADVTDDVLVREVEFHLDGVLAFSDGSFPFEYAFYAPTLTADRTSFRLRAKAIDTGGNFTWSDEVHVQLLADATPPRARPAAPSANGYVVSPSSIGVIFNEPIDAASLIPTALTLRYLGVDRAAGTADDIAVPGVIHYIADSRRAELRFDTPTIAGRYEASLAPGVTDLAGNVMTSELVWAFEMVTGTDSDGDGLTDEFETANGMNPQRADENDNGIPDAIEDFDGDGLNNGQEMLLGTHPRQPRTFDGILDSELDRDGDWLTDLAELNLGTDRTRWDTDGDGWNDEVEITTGNSPLRPNAFLAGRRMSSNAAQLLRLVDTQFRSAQRDILRLGDGQIMQATSKADVLRLDGPNENGHSVLVAQPSVRVQVDPGNGGVPAYLRPRAGTVVIEAEDPSAQPPR